MQIPNVRFSFALLVPALLALSISEAAAQKQSANAARAECFRQANEAAAAVNIASTAASAERNARGVSAIGIAPDEWESAPDAVPRYGCSFVGTAADLASQRAIAE